MTIVYVQEEDKRQQREQARIAIRQQKAEWAAKNKSAWSKGQQDGEALFRLSAWQNSVSNRFCATRRSAA